LQLKNVEFVGAVRQDELNAYYAVARAFLCLSDHEGFCIPLLEAMAHDVPVVAYAAGAVPETLDGAGVLVREKNYDLIAETSPGHRGRTLARGDPPRPARAPRPLRKTGPRRGPSTALGASAVTPPGPPGWRK
jgi:hypothetical protein